MRFGACPHCACAVAFTSNGQMVRVDPPRFRAFFCTWAVCPNGHTSLSISRISTPYPTYRCCIWRRGYATMEDTRMPLASDNIDLLLYRVTWEEPHPPTVEEPYRYQTHEQIVLAPDKRKAVEDRKSTRLNSSHM